MAKFLLFVFAYLCYGTQLLTFSLFRHGTHTHLSVCPTIYHRIKVSTSLTTALFFYLQDSLFICHQRDASPLELIEKRILKEKNISIPYHKSLVSYFLTNQFIKTIGPILDWSSIMNPDSFIFKNLIDQSESVQPQLEYLASKHKNKAFRMKCEANGMAIRTILAPSAKQHIVTAYPPDASFPIPSEEVHLLAKKIKGLPRSKHREITMSDFIDVSLRGTKGRKISSNRLSRSIYTIYLCKNTKTCLSRLSTKRLFYNKFRRNQSFFSFPLNWKTKLDE